MSDQLELAIDRTRCDGSRLCAELLPERIRLDDWGYPIIAPGAIPTRLLPHARRAVSACPLLALSLGPVDRGEDVPPGAADGKAPFTRASRPAGRMSWQ